MKQFDQNAVVIYNIFVMLGGQKVYQIKGTQFPFGVFNFDQDESRKMFVKKRYYFKNVEEYEQLILKIDKLKSISHRNTINLRSIEEKANFFIDLIYQYVPLSLEESFTENSSQTVKEMHRQFIQLAIYLAKNCILTTFNPSRCGVVINQQKSTLKYYLPLNQITITNNRNMLERSVQLFNVQSMLFLDSLLMQCHNSTINQSASQRTFKNRAKLNQGKERKDSQNSIANYLNNRKFSSKPTKQSQMRKLSTLSKQLSQITLLHKKRGSSTRISGDSFNTFRSILSLKHSHQTNPKKQSVLSDSQQTLKRCVSQNMINAQPQLNNLIARSRRALENLQNIREKMSCYKGVIVSLIKLKKEE